MFFLENLHKVYRTFGKKFIFVLGYLSGVYTIWKNINSFRYVHLTVLPGEYFDIDSPAALQDNCLEDLHITETQYMGFYSTLQWTSMIIIKQIITISYYEKCPASMKWHTNLISWRWNDLVFKTVVTIISLVSQQNCPHESDVRGSSTTGVA